MANLFIWRLGLEMHRLHLGKYGAAEFNPSPVGNARFSPITRPDGGIIPTIYAGTTFDCAAMETVFHDVPYSATPKFFDKARLNDWSHSTVAPASDLQLLDLSTISLRALGIERKDLIDTEKDRYPQTRKWAMDAYAKYPDIQGLCWVSRQDDRAQAVVLFGDRVPLGGLVGGATRDLVNDGPAYDELLELAEKIGLKIVSGRRIP